MGPPRLLAVTPGDHGAGRDLEPWLLGLGALGWPAVLLREPHIHPDELARLVAVAHAAGLAVVAHTKHPCAADCGADALHVPDGRALRGRCGASRHSAGAARAALAQGALYATLSPVWRPTSKPGDRRPPLGLAPLLAAGDHVLGLGGVTPQRAQQVADAGGWGVAVLGGLFGGSLAGLPQRARGYLAITRPRR